MNKYTDNSKSTRLLNAVIHVYNYSIIKKIFAGIGNIFGKYFFGSLTSKIFTIFEFDTAQHKNSIVLKILRGIFSPVIYVTNKLVSAMETAAGESVFVKLISSCANMVAVIFNGSVAGKLINHYLEGES